MNVIIKKEFENEVIGFGKSALPLGKRDDLNDLGIIAHESGNPLLLRLFENLPSLASLKKAKTDRELKAALPPIEEQPTEQEVKNAAVPAEFNKETKVEELNKKPLRAGK
jgi:hypothetical protein